MQGQCKPNAESLFYAEVQPVLANFQLQSYDGFCMVPTIFMLFVLVCYDMEAVL